MKPQFKEGIKGIARSLCNQDVYLALEILFIESLIFFYDKKGRWEIRRKGWRRPSKLNLGSGSILKPGYLNLDVFPGGDTTLDLRKRLPFDDNCCERVFSEHFFEHLNHLEYAHLGYPSTARYVLTECLRVLRPGGTLSLSLPDAEWPLTDYAKGGAAPFFQFGGENHWFPPSSTRMEAINRYFQQGGEHRFMYDFESMRHLLEQVGFIKIQRRDFDPNEDADVRKSGSLFVLAYKP